MLHKHHCCAIRTVLPDLCLLLNKPNYTHVPPTPPHTKTHIIKESQSRKNYVDVPALRLENRSI